MRSTGSAGANQEAARGEALQIKCAAPTVFPTCSGSPSLTLSAPRAMPRKIAFAKMHGARVSGSLPHASLKNVAHSKFTADLFDIDRLSRPFETQSAGLQELRFEQPCTQDLRSRASQDTVQSEQRSMENGA
jgi:hypothetical protein